MTSKKQLIPTKYAARTYGMTQPVDFDVAINYAGALLAIAGADGTLAEAELQWYLDEQELNIKDADAQEYIEAVRNIDWQKGNLDELLAGISYDFPLNFRRAMLYQAIKMSSADGEYHTKERAAISRAAERLGIERSLVVQLESLIDIERGCERIRQSLFTE